MTTPTLKDYERLSRDWEVVVTSKDLPLHCPLDEKALWCAHPRVFLAIQDSADKRVRCPYCGTVYRLAK